MGILQIVGIGPGDAEDLTLRADRALRESDVIIGYRVYVDLVRERYPGREFYSSSMTEEVSRCRMALSMAEAGRRTALVCSGDSGVYGMAGLVYGLRGERSQPEIRVIPGLTAACSGGALLGAPLTGDFAVISLSDRLTSWETIALRLEHAAAVDLTIVLYNPASRGRPEHLRRACQILLRALPETRLCGIARNIGRVGEAWRLLTLGELGDATDVDMFCTVFIGSKMTRRVGNHMVTDRGYRTEGGAGE